MYVVLQAVHRLPLLLSLQGGCNFSMARDRVLFSVCYFPLHRLLESVLDTPSAQTWPLLLPKLEPGSGRRAEAEIERWEAGVDRHTRQLLTTRADTRSIALMLVGKDDVH